MSSEILTLDSYNTDDNESFNLWTMAAYREECLRGLELTRSEKM